MRAATASARLAMAAAAVSFALPAGGASAASTQTMLTWACEPTDATTAEMQAALIEACGATAGSKTVCDVLSGTPFACNDKTVTGPTTEECMSQEISFTATGGTGSVLGWSVEGEVTVKGSIKFTKTVKTCEITPKTPPPTGEAGTFVKEAGTASGSASFSVHGEGRITFLGGTIFSVGHTETCSRTIGPIAIYTSDATAACHAPVTTVCDVEPAACTTPSEHPTTPITPTEPAHEEPDHGP